MRKRFLFSLLATATLAGFLLAPRASTRAQSAPAVKPKPIDFNRQIRPILSDNCFSCHGPDEASRMANMRLDLKDAAQGPYVPRDGYRIITPGDSAASRLYQRISAKDETFRMPPTYSNHKLTEAQIALIKQWIDEGAKWDLYWAFVPPQRPPLPAVKQKEWVRNPIDNFVLARLEQEGLKPSPETDKATLLRRVTLDLTGLPPTPAEIESFEADNAPDAYEKRVDALLASPHYGERMALFWLDLARYSDTHGYHIDCARNMWPWRDWVIRAFNNNMRYDEFTVDQLAGDLLPNATLDQKIATGFNRNHMINFEGGAVPAEYQNEYVVDRVEATSVTWMGLTMGCARCHDHKYDPILQKDFYRFYAFFNSIPEKGLDGANGNAAPFIEIPSPEQAKELDELNAKITQVKAAMPEKEIALPQDEWTKTALETIPKAPNQGLAAHYEFDGFLADTSGGHHHGKTLRGEVTFGMGKVGQAAEFSGVTTLDLGDAGDFDRGHPFALALWINPGGGLDHLPRTVLQKMEPGPKQTGYELAIDVAESMRNLKRGSHYIFRLVHQGQGDSIAVQSKDRFESTWHQVSINYDGSGKAAGIRLFVDGKPQAVAILNDHLTGSIHSAGHLQIGAAEIGNPFKGSIDDLRMYQRQLTRAEVEELAIHEPIRALLAFPSNACTLAGASLNEDPATIDPLAEQGLKDDKVYKAKVRCLEERATMRDYYLTWVAPEHFRQLNAELKDLEARKAKVDEAVPNSMVMQEMPNPRETYILKRGDYRNRLEKVTPGIPSILPPLAKGAVPNRLALARWLVNPNHPLTSRVAVNRFWQLYFGVGIVKTAENFGSQGEPPSHPLLLDWLATEFVRTGWDVKSFQRLIVTSATYRQSSRATKDEVERDPENRLLARGPRFRLPAEVVRDNALAASGLLTPTIGGPSVFPYQPPGLWEEMATGLAFSAQSYTPSHGADLYRRSLYTFWKRTVPPPTMLTFDAPDREKCSARRLMTNTPLQALVLLNDPTYVEAARAIATRTLNQPSSDPADRVRYVFKLATSRTPNARELTILERQAQQELDHFRQNPTAAQKLIAVGESPVDKNLNPSELAAWTMVSSTVLNLDETMTKE